MDDATDQLQVRKSGGAWGSVCDDRFNDNTAHAVCNWIGKINGIQNMGFSWSKAGRTLR